MCDAPCSIGASVTLFANDSDRFVVSRLSVLRERVEGPRGEQALSAARSELHALVADLWAEADRLEMEPSHWCSPVGEWDRRSQSALNRCVAVCAT
jgi:hypothetical protein